MVVFGTMAAVFTEKNDFLRRKYHEKECNHGQRTGAGKKEEREKEQAGN